MRFLFFWSIRGKLRENLKDFLKIKNKNKHWKNDNNLWLWSLYNIIKINFEW